MQVQTSIRDLFQYSMLSLLIVILLIAIVVLLIMLTKLIPKPAPPQIVIIEPENKQSVQQKYIELINKLINKVNNKQLTNRAAYQELSILIRHFVFEMTQIKVQNYSLNEIKTLNMPHLSALVEEYYHPEFAYLSNSNILESINKTKEVIVRWQ